MTVAGHRYERIAEEIRHEVTLMLAGELKDPRLANSVIVTEVRVTPGLKHVRVYVEVAGEAEERKDTINGLAAASGFVRHELVERLQLRRAPEIVFVPDQTEEYAQHIEDLLKKSKEHEAP
jgi:ribosome-binding factor A